MTLSLGYGLITCQRHPDDPRDWTELYAEALSLAAVADAGGLDSVWVSEHHFVDDGYMSALLPVLAAIAAVTKRAQIGTAMLLAPLHDPVRLAEDAATVDLLSGGRLILGMGLGWREEEFDTLGIARTDRARALTNAIETCRRAWAGVPLRALEDGRTFGIVTPQPARLPPIWIGARAESAIRRGARMADGYMATNVTPEELAESLAILRDEAHRIGRDPAEIEVSVHLQTFVSSERSAWDRALPSIAYQTWKYDDIRNEYGGHQVLRRPAAISADTETRLREISLVGSANQVADRVAEYTEAAGGSLHFVCRSYFPGLGATGQRRALDGVLELAQAVSSTT